MSLCDNCNRLMGDTTCMIPTDDGKYYTWEKTREVLSESGECEHYEHTSWKDKLKDHITKPYYRIARRFESVRDFFRYSVVGRVKHKIDIRDTWNLGDNIALYMKPRLRYFIDNEPMGVPGLLMTKSFVEDNELSQYYGGELNDEWFDDHGDVDEGMKAWISILEKMYYSVDYVTHKWDVEDTFNIHDVNEYGEREINREKSDELDKKVKEGFRLLGIFFQSLWD